MKNRKQKCQDTFLTPRFPRMKDTSGGPIQHLYINVSDGFDNKNVQKKLQRKRISSFPPLSLVPKDDQLP
jgi:hypothetical protein